MELFVAEGDGDFAEDRRRTPVQGGARRDPHARPSRSRSRHHRARWRPAPSPRGTGEACPSPLALVVMAPLSPPTELAATLVGEGVGLAWQGELPNPLPTPEPTPTAPPRRRRRPPATPTPPTAAPPAGPTPTQPRRSRSTCPGVAAAAPARGRGASTPSGRAPSGSRPTPTPTPKTHARPFTPGFFVYRRAAARLLRTPLSIPRPPRSAPSSTARASPASRWCYVVRAVASAEPLVESARLRTRPASTVKDILAPAAPAGVAAVARDEGIEVSLEPVARDRPRAVPGLQARTAGPAARPERLAEVPATETAFLDTIRPRREPCSTP